MVIAVGASARIAAVLPELDALLPRPLDALLPRPLDALLPHPLLTLERDGTGGQTPCPPRAANARL